MSAPGQPIADRQGTLPAFLARMWWMFFGDILLAFSFIFIVQNGGGMPDDLRIVAGHGCVTPNPDVDHAAKAE